MTLFKKFKRFLVECKRVLIVTKKPSGQEFSTIMKVSGLGMILIGLIGFLVMIVATFIKMINI